MKEFVLSEVISMLKDNLSVPVWSDYVPGGNESGCAVNHVANSEGRVLSGHKYGLWSTWRVTVVAKHTSDVELIIKELLKLDNTRNDDFQKVKTNLVLIEPKEPEQTYRRAFVDVRVYNN